MKKIKDWPKWIFWFTLGVVIIVIYKALDSFANVSIWIKNLINVISPFLSATLLSYLLYIPCRNIENLYKKYKITKKHARTLSIFTVYIMSILLIVIIINTVLPAITESISDLASNLPSYYQSSKEYINNLPEDFIIDKVKINEAIGNLEKIDIMSIISLENVKDYFEKAKGLVGVIFNMFVTVVVSIYLLAERTSILNFMRRLTKSLFKKETYEKIDKYFCLGNTIFFKFVSSQIIDAFIVGVITSIVMKIMGIKYAILLGFMIGLLNIIPYFGAIIAIILAGIITIFTGGFSKAIWMVVIVTILQQIDANIINPRIIGNALELSPILVIFAVTVGGAYFGILGMFLAVPIFCLIKLMLNDYMDYKLKDKEET